MCIRDSLSYIDIAKAEGARLRLGGAAATRPECGDGWFVEPTIFTGVDNSSRIAQEEVFGPVLVVIKYRTVDEAIEIANDSEYGLSAGVWSEDIDAALDVAAQIESGTVWINDWHMVNALYPFGGYKQSGNGRELGPHALDEYTEEKFIHVDLARRIESKVYDLVVPEGD